MIRAVWNGTVIAESDETVVIEGNQYFPADSVRPGLLRPSTTTTVCPWKGRASHHTINVDGSENRGAAWLYPHPSSAASAVAGRVAFWHGVKIEDGGGPARRRSFLNRFRRDERAAPDTDEHAHTELAPVVDSHRRRILRLASACPRWPSMLRSRSTDSVKGSTLTHLSSRRRRRTQEPHMTLRIDDPLPDLELVDHSGRIWRTADQRGRPLVLVLHRHLA